MYKPNNKNMHHTVKIKSLNKSNIITNTKEYIIVQISYIHKTQKYYICNK